MVAASANKGPMPNKVRGRAVMRNPYARSSFGAAALPLGSSPVPQIRLSGAQIRVLGGGLICRVASGQLPGVSGSPGR
jgi:hypothetical protein